MKILNIITKYKYQIKFLILLNIYKRLTVKHMIYDWLSNTKYILKNAFFSVQCMSVGSKIKLSLYGQNYTVFCVGTKKSTDKIEKK